MLNSYTPRDNPILPFLDAIWDGQQGHACITVRVGSGMKDTWFEWPQDRTEIESYALQEAPQRDVYFIPALQGTPVRKKGNTPSARNAWVDLDDGEIPRAWLRKLGPILIESGTPGRLHLHLLMDQALPIDQLVEANRSLARILGGDMAPTHEAALMRLPGTMNHKTSPPRPVHLISDPAMASRLAVGDLPTPEPTGNTPETEKRFSAQEAKDYIETLALEPLRSAGEPGRNIQLNNSAAVLSHFVPEFWERDEAVEMLIEAADECGVLADDGHEQCLATIASGLSTASWKATRVSTDLDAEISKLRNRDLAAREYEKEKYPFASALAAKSFQRGSDLMAKYDKFKTEPPKFLVRGVIKERSYGALGAEYKAGKTWMALDLMVSVATGTPWMGQFEVPERSRVAYMLGEGQEDEFFRRLEAICRARRVDIRELLTSWVSLQVGSSNLSDPDQLERIHRELSIFQPGLTIVDPWYLSAGDVDGKNIVVAGKVLDNLAGMARSLESALLIAQHWNKTGQGNGTARWAGSGLQEWSRYMINVETKEYLDAVPDDPEGRTLARLRVAFTGEVSGKYVVERSVWTDDYLDAGSDMHYAADCRAATEQESDTKTSFEDRVYQALSEAGVPQIKSELFAALGVSSSGRSSQINGAKLDRLYSGSDPRIVPGPNVGRSQTWTIKEES